MINKNTILTIAGSDPSGGAGIQTDIRTIDRLSLYPCTVITAITAQNSKKVSGIWRIDPKEVEAQLHSVLSDFHPEAVKVGMIPDAEIIELVAHLLADYEMDNIVVDPVLSPTLLKTEPNEELVKAYGEFLFPLATLITPNLKEKEAMERIIGKPLETGCRAILLKGGHYEGEEIVDTLYFHGITNLDKITPSSAFPTLNFSHSSLYNHDSILPPPAEYSEEMMKREFLHKRIKTENTHGTGCVLSTAIACFLGIGSKLEDAVEHAIKFTTDSLRYSSKFKISEGNYGPALV